MSPDLAAENESLRAENDKLRYILAVGSDPCIYCTLPASDMPKCERGFPGCGRMDDITVGELKGCRPRNEKAVN